jgi:hypothetical protein
MREMEKQKNCRRDRVIEKEGCGEGGQKSTVVESENEREETHLNRIGNRNRSMSCKN